MMKLKFVIKDDKLVLRISECKQRFYKSVRGIITGQPDFKKHWNPDKECFRCNFPGYKENNKALRDFKENYVKLILEHPEFTAKQVSLYWSHEPVKETKIADEPIVKAADYCNSVEKFLERVIQREKLKKGCNFETYHKLLLKCRKIIPGFSKMSFTEINYDKCVHIAEIFLQHKGYYASTKCFRNMLGKAHKDRDVMFKISQIGDFRFRDYDPDKDEVKIKKPDILNAKQLHAFLNLDLSKTTPGYDNRNDVRLYYDFCVFMFHSFMSPCDVIKLKTKDITPQNTIVFKRKKTHCPVEVPVSPAMEQIIARYSGLSKDGYIFPIQDDEKEKDYKTRDYFFKKFREQLNWWLKPLGKELGCTYKLYAYVFRHTAITVALDHGLPISYVALVAGTSIEMIQDHYYNGDNQNNSQKLQMAFLKAAM